MRCLFVLDLYRLFSLFFPLAAKLIGPKTGCQFLRNIDFFDNGPLKGMTPYQAFVGIKPNVDHSKFFWFYLLCSCSKR